MSKDSKNVKNIEKIMISFIEYMKLDINNKIDFMLPQNTEENKKNLDKKYKECIENIKELNRLSEANNLKKIYNGKLDDKEKIREFILDINNEIFKNRKISRK